jgi:hypothetical protein
LTLHVFLGPTLSRAEAERALPGANIYGPVAFGDVYRSVKAGARAIAIVDGYFERVPAVWHKEILWAMSEGIHVFGASSMGALRAAELADFGMQGVGTIYEAYRGGALEDDDEVTIAHGPAEDEFVPHSDAMVNIRATFLAAVNAGVVSSQTAALLIAAAKRRFYAERAFALALKDASQAGVAHAELEPLQAWLPAGRVDQKAADARQLFSHLRNWLLQEPKALRVGYRLEPTDAWLEARRIADAMGQTVTTRPTQDAIEEELKLTGTYLAVRDGAIARAAALDEARRAGFRPDEATTAQAAETLRRELGLTEHADFVSWQAREHLGPAQLRPFFEDRARVIWAQGQTQAWAEESLVDHLRALGRYGELIARAEAKTRRLATLGPRGPSLADLGVTEQGLWRWFFETKLERSVPDDLGRFAWQSGFADTDEMRSALLRELHFERATAHEPSTP